MLLRWSRTSSHRSGSNPGGVLLVAIWATAVSEGNALCRAMRAFVIEVPKNFFPMRTAAASPIDHLNMLPDHWPTANACPCCPLNRAYSQLNCPLLPTCGLCETASCSLKLPDIARTHGLALSQQQLVTLYTGPLNPPVCVLVLEGTRHRQQPPTTRENSRAWPHAPQCLAAEQGSTTPPCLPHRCGV
jgi:hypothetical protein